MDTYCILMISFEDLKICSELFLIWIIAIVYKKTRFVETEHVSKLITS